MNNLFTKNENLGTSTLHKGLIRSTCTYQFILISHERKDELEMQ